MKARLWEKEYPMPYDFRTAAERDLDDEYERHIDGECRGPSIDDKDHGYCEWCEQERERQQYEDTIDARAKRCAAKLDATALLWRHFEFALKKITGE